MNKTETLITLLSTKEKQLFLNFLRKRNTRSDAKNTHLFKALLNDSTEKLKKELGSNAYNVLKKRLTDNLMTFLSGQLIENEKSAETEISRGLILGRKLFEHKAFKLGFELLKKAEKQAQEIQNFHLLNEIYQTLIEYSFHTLAPDQNDLFTAYAANQKKYEREANLNMAYAVIRKTFYDHERQPVNFDVSAVIAKTFEKFNVSANVGYNFQSLAKIAEMANIYGTLNRDYYGIDLFFEQQVKHLQGGVLDVEDQLGYHIELLYILAYIYFRKKQFERSLSYIRELEEHTNRYNQKFYGLWQVRKKTLMALNFNFLGQSEKAAQLLDELLKIPVAQIERQKGLLQTKLSRIMIHFQQGEFKAAKKILSRLNKSDNWYLKNMGREWLLNMKFMEILLHIELGNTDYVDSRINSLLRQQKLFDTDPQALPFLTLVKIYHQNPITANAASFRHQVDQAFEWKPSEQEDLFLISFYAWLKSKMINSPLYETTLNLIHQK